MKKEWIAGLVLSSALALGACSNENEAGGKEAPDDTQQEETQKGQTEPKEKEEQSNKAVFTVDGKEQEIQLVSRDVLPELAQEVYLPSGFEITKDEEEVEFAAKGKEEYKDVILYLFREQSEWPIKEENLIYELEKKAVNPWGGEVSDGPSIATPIELDEYPELKERYDYIIKSQRAEGLAYFAFKTLNEHEAVRLNMLILSEEQEKYEELGLELMRKVKFPEPAE